MKILIILILFFTQGSYAQDVNEIVKQTHLNSYYSAENGKAQMLMKIYGENSDKPIKKLFYMLRIDLEDGGKQMFYTYFLRPTDIKRTTFLVHKNIEKDDFRRLYIPASDKVLAIAGSRKQDPFMGSDYTYEDVSGRHYFKDNHKLLGVGEIDKIEVYLTESIPKQKESKIAKINTWISKKDLLPLKVEYTNHNGVVYRRFVANKVELVDKIKTITSATMYSLLEKTKTEMLLNIKKTKYNIGLTKDIFSERSLKNPPMEYFK